MSIFLQDAIFRQLRDFIYEKCGIFIPDTKKYLLENRLVKIIQDRGLKGFDEYLFFVTNGCCDHELARLFDSITTNETFFFREPQQLDALINEVAGRVAEQNKTKIIKIWSSACSTGEEPYTIAMMFKEQLSSLKAEILASDISSNVLESAKKAVYGSYSVRNVPENYLKKYFNKNGQSFVLENSIKNCVRLKNINLIDEKGMKNIKDMDVIFCRNVLIYFDDKAKQKVISHLYNSIKPGGFLFIGTSESLHNITRAFVPVVINKVVVYQKR